MRGGDTGLGWGGRVVSSVPVACGVGGSIVLVTAPSAARGVPAKGEGSRGTPSSVNRLSQREQSPMVECGFGGVTGRGGGGDECALIGVLMALCGARITGPPSLEW